MLKLIYPSLRSNRKMTKLPTLCITGKLDCLYIIMHSKTNCNKYCTDIKEEMSDIDLYYIIFTKYLKYGDLDCTWIKFTAYLSEFYQIRILYNIWLLLQFCAYYAINCSNVYCIISNKISHQRNIYQQSTESKCQYCVVKK